jgi:hypothetical protein
VGTFRSSWPETAEIDPGKFFLRFSSGNWMIRFNPQELLRAKYNPEMRSGMQDEGCALF